MAAKARPTSAAGQQSHAPKTTMKAIVQHRYGASDVLAVEEIDNRSPGTTTC
jgi:hypothetical protein